MHSWLLAAARALADLSRFGTGNLNLSSGKLSLTGQCYLNRAQRDLAGPSHWLVTQTTITSSLRMNLLLAASESRLRPLPIECPGAGPAWGPGPGDQRTREYCDIIDLSGLFDLPYAIMNL